MNLRVLLLVCSMLATAASGQTHSPELVPTAAKYKADLAALDSQLATAIASAQQPYSSNALVNGTFDVADTEGKPTGWTVPDRKEASVKVVREGSNYVLRATLEGEVRPFYITQEIPIPPRTKTVTLSGRIRGKWENRDTKDGNWGATIDSTFLGADEKKFGGWIILVGGREAGWANLKKTEYIPEGAKALHVHFGFQFVTGTFDFDDISVEFR